MQYSTLSRYFIYVFILFAFSACSIFSSSTETSDASSAAPAAGSKEAKAKADKAEKNLQSNICKGKVDHTGARKLVDFVAQPTAFFCNMSKKMLLALEHQYRALGNLEREAQAKQTREKIENGTYGPQAVGALMVSVTPTDEEKLATQKFLEDDADGAKKREMQLAKAEMNAANKEFALGMTSVLLEARNAIKAVKQAKKASKDRKKLDQIVAAAQVIKVVSDVAQISTLSSGLRQASVQWEINNKHLERVAGYENYANAGDKPDIPNSNELAAESDEG
jgi:hypothetical protein